MPNNLLTATHLTAPLRRTPQGLAIPPPIAFVVRETLQFRKLEYFALTELLVLRRRWL
jgi:hypothetical protein